MPRHKYLLIGLFVVLVPLPTLAQTAADFHQRYKVSSRIESFDVRPGIIATISYDEEGQVVSILLTPPRVSNEHRPVRNEMPMKAVKGVLDELVPVAKRGEVCEDYGFAGSIYALNRRIDYENVTISSVTRGDVAAQSVLIEWVKCAGKLRP